MKHGLAFICILFMTGCVTHRDIKEIKTISFDENVSKGKSTGQFEADDCVFHVMGVRLGGQPDVSRAIANSRTMKQSKVTEIVSDRDAGKPIRYANNVSVTRGGFNAYVFGKDCIVVKGVAYR